MNSVVEKLTAIEQEVAALQPKMAPLAERIAALDKKIAGFSQQLIDVAAESAAVKKDIEFARKGLTRVQTLVSESRAESEQLEVGQEENLQRYKAMEAFVGTLYQLHSQSVEIAQWLGRADQAKAVFPAPPLAPVTLTVPPVAKSPEPPPADKPTLPAPEPIAKPVLEELPAEEPPAPEPVAGPVPEELPAEEPPAPEPVAELVPEELPAEEPPAPKPIAEPMLEELPAAELPVAEPPTEESILSESDFDSALSDASDKTPDPLTMPGLPDVMARPEIEAAPSDDDDDTDVEPSDAMASHLDVPPLNLAVPAMSEQSESATADETDEQDIEAMLADMMTPVTVGS